MQHIHLHRHKFIHNTHILIHTYVPIDSGNFDSVLLLAVLFSNQLAVPMVFVYYFAGIASVSVGIAVQIDSLSFPTRDGGIAYMCHM